MLGSNRERQAIVGRHAAWRVDDERRELARRGAPAKSVPQSQLGSIYSRRDVERCK
jgi:hypothetical protein